MFWDPGGEGGGDKGMQPFLAHASGFGVFFMPIRYDNFMY